MINQHDIARLNRLSDEYETFLRPLRIADFNSPVNRAEEKSKLLEAFAQGIEYNPQFQYRESPAGWEKPLIGFLRELDPLASKWDHYLYQDASKVVSELESVSSHNPDKITAETIYSYGIPTPDLVQKATALLSSTKSKDEEGSVSAVVAAERLQSALLSSGLSDWVVEVKSPMNAMMMVRSVEKKVLVREDAFFSEANIKRLLVHEIGTHVFRYINGERQPFRMLRLSLIGYLDTEEGLATYHEKYFGVQDDSALRTYALRVVAAQLSFTLGFFDIFAQLSKYSPNLDQLFDIVTRTKRGFKDTKHVGGHLKDQVYLKGLLNVSAHLSQYPDDYDLIMCGKVSLAMVEDLRKLADSGILKSPQFTPSILL